MVLDLIKLEILTAFGVPKHIVLGGDMAEVPSRVCGHLGKEVKEIYNTVIANEADLDKILEEFNSFNQF